MQSKWLNDGEPDDNGEYCAVIENAQGQRISTFKGKSYKEVADKLLNSQAEANRKIAKLMRPDSARIPQQIKVEGNGVVAPADRLRLSNEITDPDRIVEAVTEIVTHAQGGVKPYDVATNLASMNDNEQRAYFRQEANAFVEANPEYYPVQQNQEKLFATLKDQKWDMTRNNLAIVFQALLDQGEMIPWPDEPTDGPPSNEVQAAPNGRPEPNPPTPTNGNTRPRSISTGIRSSDASATPPPPRAPQRLTRADIERMPRAEYNERMRDPKFRAAVDAM
jgi:hypothetical protein